MNKIPNSTTALVLSILAYIGCCCFTGFSGILLSGISLYLIKKGEAVYAEAPEAYDNYNQLKTAKVVAIIALILSAVMAAFYIILKAQGIDEQTIQMMIEELQNQ